jgi:hypothetical protein
MKKIIITKLFILTFFFITYSGFSQKTINTQLKEFPYPKGLYESFNDFKLKQANGYKIVRIHLTPF